MSKQFYVLKEEEKSMVLGGNIIDAGKIFLEAFLNTGTAFACIGIAQEVHNKFCTTNTSWVKVCEVSKELAGIAGFTLHTLVPTIYKGLDDPLLHKTHPD